MISNTGTSLQFTRFQIFAVLGVLFLIVIIVLMSFGVIPGFKKSPQDAVTGEIKFWALSETVSAYEGAIISFATVQPGVRVTTRYFEDPETYEKTVIDALAAGAGPDVFMIPNTKLFQYGNKITPIPPQFYSMLKLREAFPQTVEEDFTYNGAIYALPLSIDTLALIYNRDLLDERAVAPPSNWQEFLEAAKKLTVMNDRGEITQSGAAIGGVSDNILNAEDLIYTLLQQAEVTGSQADSNKSLASKEGEQVVQFYAQFGDKGQVQAWSDKLGKSLDAFTQEKTAMIFAYSQQLQEIMRRNPSLNIGIQTMPQNETITKSVTVPSYWGYVVAKQSKLPSVAAQFIGTLTLNTQAYSAYLQAAKNPPALRNLLSKYAQHPQLAVFTKQTLQAHTAYPDKTLQSADETIKKMIDDVVTGTVDVRKATQQAAGKLGL